MKFITPKFEIVEQAPGMKGMLEHIERAGRTCYKSHDKTTEGSAEKFVERMKSNQHLSVLEHGTVYLIIECDFENALTIEQYKKNEHSHVFNWGLYFYITTNYRVIVENGWEEDLQFQCEPTERHEKRVTVRFNTDIGISREFNRHRVNSISEESTRYCNYSKGKFGGELSVVPPIEKREEVEEKMKAGLSFFYNDNAFLYDMCCEAMSIIKNGETKAGKNYFDDIETWLFAVLSAQWSYMRLTQQFGWSAQQARSILPLCTATELVHTAFVSDWENFFRLRADSHAHPMARELAIPLREEFIKRGYIKKIGL